jgi:hypothetical protein
MEHGGWTDLDMNTRKGCLRVRVQMYSCVLLFRENELKKGEQGLAMRM